MDLIDLGIKDDFRGAVEAVRRELDTQCEFMALMAKLKRAYFEALVAEGFSEEQALELTKAHSLASY